MATQQELSVPPGHFAMQGPDGSAIFFPVDTPQEAVNAEMERVYGSQDEATYYDQPGLSEANPIDLRTTPPDQRASLTKGTWVIGGDGTVYALPTDAYTDAQRPGDQPLEGGLIQRPQGVAGGVSDFAQSAGAGLIQGVTGLAGMPRAINDLQEQAVDFAGRQMGLDTTGLYDKLRQAEGFINPLSSARGPSTEQINRGLADVFGELYAPQTTAGEYARTAGEFAPGAIVPGGALTRLASWLAPALASETAGQVAERFKPEWEEGARILGGLLGGFGVGGVSAVRGGPDRVIRNATRGVTEQQLEDALQLRGSGQGFGVPLTQADALDEVTGGATNLGRIQRVVTPQSPELSAFMAQRPAQARAAVDRMIEQVSPQVDPAEASRLASSTAEAVLSRMRQRVNESARPLYQAADNQVVSAEEYTALQELPTYRIAEEAVLNNPEIRIVGGPRSIEAVNAVIKRMRTMEEAAVPSLGNSNADMELAAVRGSQTDIAREVSGMASPDLAMARQTGASGRGAFVDPLRTGPIGALAKPPELGLPLPQQTAAVFPTSPAEGGAAQSLQALNLMNEINPAAGPALTRQHLATQANEIMQAGRGGGNPYAGADFIARLMGNREQERTLLGAIDMADPLNDARGLARVLRATGKTEGAGSRTADNQLLQNDLSGGNFAQETTRSIAAPTGIPTRIARAFDEEIARRNADRLAAFLMADPEESRRAILRSQLNRSGSNRTRAAIALTQGDE
jgi:hypothetical protein